MAIINKTLRVLYLDFCKIQFYIKNCDNSTWKKTELVWFENKTYVIQSIFGVPVQKLHKFVLLFWKNTCHPS